MAQTIIVDTTPGYRMPTIYYSQGDIGRTFSIDLQSRFGESLPASPTITIQATKPSGLGFSVASTSISGAVVTFTVTETMSNEAGRFPAELKIVKNSVTLFTANFYIDCEANAHPEGTTDGDIDHIMPKFMSVTTTTLPAGDSATYSFDANTNTATFGIPKGADGSLASQVLAADYSSSKTYAVGDYVYYSGNLYRCTTAITTAEAWTSGHWTQVALADDVSDVKSDITELQEGGYVADAQQIQEKVDNYLDEHPEATTTVQDGSLTEAKFSNALKLKTIKDYVTPEMFGAVGDGVTDDTDSINTALESASVVVLLDKTYKTTKPIYVPSNTTLMGIDKVKSKIYNTGIGWDKNAIVAGYVVGDTESNGILHTPSITYTKTGSHTFTSAHIFDVGDIVHFRVDNADNAISQKISTSTYIVCKDNNTYVTKDTIPDSATLHSYMDIEDDTEDSMRHYVTFGATISNLTVEHLPTGSGMYGLFVCGAEDVVENVVLICNTGLASNVSVHNKFINVDCYSYGDIIDCAEYVYNTLYKNINVNKIYPTAETLHTQFAFGRGHNITVDNFTSDIELSLALNYTEDFLMINSNFWASSISTTNKEIVFKNCKIYSTNELGLRNCSYYNCYFSKPTYDSSYNGVVVDVESDYTNMNEATRNVVHMMGYKTKIGYWIDGKSSYSFNRYDHGIKVTVTGSNLSLTDGSHTKSATSSIALIVTVGGLVRYEVDGGAITAPGWSVVSQWTVTGDITSVKKETLVNCNLLK